MPLYMTQFSYTAEAVAAMTKKPQDRSIGLAKLIEKLGGKLLCCYFCFGDYDGVAIAEVPDGTTELALVMAASTPGHLSATKTTRLFTMEESVEAMKLAAVPYSGPGG